MTKTWCQRTPSNTFVILTHGWRFHRYSSGRSLIMISQRGTHGLCGATEIDCRHRNAGRASRLLFLPPPRWKRREQLQGDDTLSKLRTTRCSTCAHNLNTLSVLQRLRGVSNRSACSRQASSKNTPRAAVSLSHSVQCHGIPFTLSLSVPMTRRSV